MPDDDEAVFITTDSRMRDGKLDPDDEKIIGGMRIMTPLEAFELPKEESGRRKKGKKKSPETPLREDAIELTPDQMQALAQQAGETLRGYEEIAEAIIMRLQYAGTVRQLRIDDSCSWRAVARGVHEQLSAKGRSAITLWEPVSNQLMGMALCKVAAETYDQDYMQPPWN